MLNITDPTVRQHLLEGNFGLEKESLRIYRNGRLSHSPHPFANHKHIVRDFCENQTEINTVVHKSIDGAIGELFSYTNRIRSLLLQLPEPEYLWPFSNPPYIENERDIPVASFEGIEVSKTAYRNYLAEKYGKYKSHGLWCITVQCSNVPPWINISTSSKARRTVNGFFAISSTGSTRDSRKQDAP